MRMRRSTKELERIARGIVHGDIITSKQIPPDLLMNCFMPLAFLRGQGAQGVLDRIGKKGFFYEHMSARGVHGINGYPCFASVQIVQSSEATIIMQACRRLLEAEEAALA